MSKVEISKKNVAAAYKVADESGKKLLDALFGTPKVTPTLGDYKTIKTYEDACEALGVEPICGDHIYSLRDEGCGDHIIALMKLETISKALWGESFEPKPDAEGSKTYYYPWFALYTKEEINRMNEDDKGALLSGSANTGTLAGFGYLRTYYRSSYSSANYGFRLCQETPEQAKYFGQQFVELWGQYLAFNFTVGERL